MAEIDSLDPVDANNIARWPEGMQFRQVNNSARADEGLLARWFRDTNCSLVASGSSNAFAVTANRALSGYADNLIIGFTSNQAITGPATLNVSGLGAKSITRADGTPLLSGDIANGQKVLVVYAAAIDKLQLLVQPATAAAISIRVGTVLAWPTENIPSGFLLADGSAVSRTTWAALFAEYGTRYGVGDGSTTFNLPDYRDQFLRGHSATGTDAGSRTDRGDGTTGANVGTKQAGATASHAHTGSTASAGAHTHFAFNTDSIFGPPTVDGATSAIDAGQYSSNVFNYTIGGSATAPTVGLTSSNGAHTHTVTVDPTSGSETRPKNVTVNWIIVATPGAALATSGTGRNEERIVAQQMTARATQPAVAATRDSGAADITQPVFDFADAGNLFVHFTWIPPKRWNRGTVTFIPYWTADAGTLGQNVNWFMNGRAFSDNDATDVGPGTSVPSTDTLQTLGALHIGPETSGITIAGTPQPGDMVVFQIGRDTTDSFTGTARLFGIKLIWTSNAVSDD
jgi:hypothetical protein